MCNFTSVTSLYIGKNWGWAILWIWWAILSNFGKIGGGPYCAHGLYCGRLRYLSRAKNKNNLPYTQEAVFIVSYNQQNQNCKFLYGLINYSAVITFLAFNSRHSKPCKECISRQDLTPTPKY